MDTAHPTCLNLTINCLDSLAWCAKPSGSPKIAHPKTLGEPVDERSEACRRRSANRCLEKVLYLSGQVSRSDVFGGSFPRKARAPVGKQATFVGGWVGNPTSFPHKARAPRTHFSLNPRGTRGARIAVNYQLSTDLTWF